MRVPVIQTGRASFIRRRDPRVKVALFVLLIIFIYVAPNWVWMAGMAATGVVLAMLARAPLCWLVVLLALQIPNILGLVAIPAAGQLMEGDLTLDGRLQFGLKLALAWVASILIGVSLVSSMEIDELVEGMAGVGVPRPVASAVGYVFLLAYLGFGDMLRIGEAMRLKGIELDWRQPLRFMADLIRLMPPLVFTVMRRGAAMSAALSLRGYSATRAPLRRVPLKFDSADALALACGLLVVGYAGGVQAGVAPPPVPAMAASGTPDR